MTSAKLCAGRYEVIRTSTACEIRLEGQNDWRVWVLYSDGRRVTWSLTKRDLLVYCQEHPEL